MTDTLTVQEPNAPETGQSHRDESVILIKNYTIASLAPAVFPFPLLDLAALTGIQLKMLHSLSKVYGVEFSAELGKATIASLVASVLPVAVTPLLASLVKFIPGVGQVSGVASMLILGVASTHALGMVLVRHFEDRGDFSNFDAQTAKAYFEEEFEKGKQIAAELKQQAQKGLHPPQKSPPLS
ncbi:GTPase [Thioploca ingrica]|uniref:GTPase n=1 Tax=Thioploca ingrica TaxID=40754 RepID=A0A090ANQ7_9GAMM|nr:GTPase [Thioploca ingrica]